MSDIKMTEVERFNKALNAAFDILELENYSACSSELFSASNAILTTIESLQGELKAADDHEGTLKHAFHVRQNINEKELYDKNKTIESQKEEIARLRFQDAEWGAAHETLNIQFESLKAITERQRNLIYLAIAQWEYMDSEDDPMNVIDKVMNTLQEAKSLSKIEEIQNGTT